MDKFETELTGNLEEPTTPEYEQEKDNLETSDALDPDMQEI